jgi:hypothetical protein
MNLRGEGHPQAYVLFGCSTGDVVKGAGLGTHELCQFIVDVGRRNSDAIHVGFAFSYDANMIVQSLHTRNLRKLHEQGWVTVGRYCIQMRRGKWFSVTEYADNYDRKTNPHAKVTVRIYDLFGFFQRSFVKAVEELLGVDTPGLDIVREGKTYRGSFDDMEYVEHYWRSEIEILRQLAEELRVRVYGAGLKITQWHGPGALASYVMRREGVRKHMAVNDDEIRQAARYAYAGGRFELFKAGRVTQPIYSLDINSAYPFAISQLPSLSEGEWRHTSNPERVVRFGVYRVRMRVHAGFDKVPSPLFHRDDRHNISYPWVVEGWYWSPEVARIIGHKDVEVLEGWEYLGAHTLPFAWVGDMYEQRREWKSKGYGAQIALKLCMNSLYGKMAQRVGYDPKTGRTPPWHQLEWAGWVTSYTRSMLYGVMRRIPWSHLIAVETDGIYTTYPPEKLHILDSNELGGWEVARYDELVYLQSGLAWLRSGDEWTAKRRGLDPDSMTLDETMHYAKTLRPNAEWSPFVGRTTRFIGLGAALGSKAPTKALHCVWQTRDREVTPGERGKRIHVSSMCAACKRGMTAYDGAHDLVIRSRSRVGEMSAPHAIPWEQDPASTEVEWLQHAAEMEELHRA